MSAKASVMSDEWCSLNTKKSIDLQMKVFNDIAKIACIDDWCSMKSKCSENHGQGHDFSPNSFLVTLQDNTDPEKKIDFVMKQAPEATSIIRQYFPVSRLYANEWHFYGRIWPLFQKFQEIELGETIFDKIAKCFAAELSPNHEKICTEYLRPQNFQKMHIRDVFDKEHLDYILREYGKFHAISIAFKKKNFHNFFEISNQLYNYYSEFSDIEPVKNSMKEIMTESMTYLMEENEIQLIQTFRPYVEKSDQIFMQTMKYQGKNGVILHGDSWSNNMMYKYSETNGDLEDIRLCNFQSCFVGTPVYDISLCLYSGASMELDIYQNVDHFLAVYHESLKETLRRFDCNADIVYSFDSLQREWKEYCKFGFFIAMLLMRRRLVEPGDDLSLTEVLHHPEKVRTQKHDEPAYKNRILNLIRHMYLHDFLDTPIRIEELDEVDEKDAMDDFSLEYM